MSTPQTDPAKHEVEDPIPDPEPASPSLDEPDLGVFHHDPAQPFPRRRNCYIHPSVIGND